MFLDQCGECWSIIGIWLNAEFPCLSTESSVLGLFRLPEVNPVDACRGWKVVCEKWKVSCLVYCITHGLDRIRLQNTQMWSVQIEKTSYICCKWHFPATILDSGHDYLIIPKIKTCNSQGCGTLFTDSVPTFKIYFWYVGHKPRSLLS